MQDNRFELFDISVSLVCKTLQKLKSDVMQTYGLKSSHLLFMIQLGEKKDGLTASELSRVGHMDKAQISRVISELTGKGFITKSGPGSQKYRHRLILTESGRIIAGEISQFLDNALEYISGSIPRADMEVFYRTLFAISDNLFSLTAQPEALGSSE